MRWREDREDIGKKNIAVNPVNEMIVVLDVDSQVRQ